MLECGMKYKVYIARAIIAEFSLGMLRKTRICSHLLYFLLFIKMVYYLK